MAETETRQILADIFGGLLDYEASEQFDLKHWYDVVAVGAKKDMRARLSGSANIPHELWHYLADADIRAKDLDYASTQIASVKALLGLET